MQFFYLRYSKYCFAFLCPSPRTSRRFLVPVRVVVQSSLDYRGRNNRTVLIRSPHWRTRSTACNKSKFLWTGLKVRPMVQIPLYVKRKHRYVCLKIFLEQPERDPCKEVPLENPPLLAPKTWTLPWGLHCNFLRPKTKPRGCVCLKTIKNVTKVLLRVRLKIVRSSPITRALPIGMRHQCAMICLTLRCKIFLWHRHPQPMAIWVKSTHCMNVSNFHPILIRINRTCSKTFLENTSVACIYEVITTKVQYKLPRLPRPNRAACI